MIKRVKADKTLTEEGKTAARSNLEFNKFSARALC
ncbi:hypothetical protein FHW88_002580 [Mucilaginibacter sp. SG538B]|nr:hypothetical protein [Mucilaginibacter sp. SG538B]